MNCPNCGTTVDNETAFCPNCGAKIEKNTMEEKPVTEEVKEPVNNVPQVENVENQVNVQPVVNNTPQPVAPANNEANGATKFDTIYIVTVCALTVVIICLALILMNK